MNVLLLSTGKGIALRGFKFNNERGLFCFVEGSDGVLKSITAVGTEVETFCKI